MLEQKSKNEIESQPSISVSRTIGGTVVEAISLLIMSGAWVLTILISVYAPSGGTGHEGFLGTVTDTSAKVKQGFTLLVETFAIVYLLYSAYQPAKRINLPFRLTSARQLVIAVCMCRFMAVMLALCFFHDTLLLAWPGSMLPAVQTAFPIVILTTLLLFCLAIFRTRDRSRKTRFRL